jgi:hypothetical protein
VVGNALLWVLSAVAPAWGALPCANPSDPAVCLINSTVTVPVGIYDIRPKSLSVGNRTITVSGAGELKILAANVTFQPGARFIATGTDGETTVTLDATGTIDIQSQGTSKSKIDVSGNFGGGVINLFAVGNITVNGTLIANATNLLGFGGPITLRSETGSITVTGDPSEGIKSFGNAQGGGGAITIDAPLGSISISTQLVPKGGDCGSCEINLNAGINITATAQGVMDLRASGIGDGGYFSASAGGNINLAGNILANGSSDELEGGAGGDVLISAIGSITVGGRIELNGAGQDAVSSNGISVDGDGGSLDVSAGTTIQMNGPMFGISKGFGQGDEFSFDAVGNITLAAEIDLTSDNFGGDITAISDGLITVSARLRTTAIIDTLHPSALGGTIDIEGCQVNVTTAGQLISTGPGGSPSGANFVLASTGMTIAGQLTASSENELVWRTSAPVITRAPIPAPVLIQDPNLPCCGVSCPVTTTSTSTTTTSTSPLPTTSSTSTSRPTTTSTSTSRPTTTTTSSTSTSTSTSSTTSTSTTTSRPTTTSTSSTSTTSTSTSSTTSTTLVVGCPTAPLAGCQTGARVQILVNEKTFGKEQIKVKVDKLLPDVALGFFGDPVAGTTGFAVCLYDESSRRIATLRVNRPQQQCGTRPCWKIAGGTSYKYSDKLLAADGMLVLQTKSGPAGTGRFLAKAKRNLPKGFIAMPTGVAPQLTGDRRATVQLMSSNAGCITGTATNVKEASGTLFKGTTP